MNDLNGGYKLRGLHDLLLRKTRCPEHGTVLCVIRLWLLVLRCWEQIVSLLADACWPDGELNVVIVFNAFHFFDLVSHALTVEGDETVTCDVF